DDVLAELDVVVASVHTHMRMEKEEATRRLVSAVEHDEVDVLGHPSGRLINDREGYPYDFDEVLGAAKREGVALELNANPHRLDVWDSQVRRAVEEDVLVSVNTDAHSTSDYSNLRYGVATARRGWAEADDVLNTMRTEEIEEWLGS
ncbi:MAG: DNA polymerase/3'-5' exonuclease PolX, partial [Halobacteria archaeon]|nr:DNA polymerase/3'-5' exonuclease PolX [Halobacteria archaeon]